MSSPINNSVRDVAGPAEVAAAITYYTHHELRRKTKINVMIESYLTLNIHYMYTGHCSITQHRKTRIYSPPSKLKYLRCEHWESAPVPTSSHTPVPPPLAASTTQQWRPRRCCATPTAIELLSYMTVSCLVA